MQEERIELIDIADDLLIVNKHTIDTLFRLENSADCVALYMFYYKTAKWQKTNQIKASDTYVKSCLKWGIEKTRRTKKILRENGLIDVVQSRENNRITGWYIKVSYLVSKKKIEECKTITVSKNTQNQQVANPTSSEQEINALKDTIKSLKKEIEMLKDKNIYSQGEQVNEIVEYLNEVLGTEYKPTSKKTKDLINARLKEGFTVEDFKTVIYKKAKQWIGDPKMCKYLRPETLFSNKFEGYLNEKAPLTFEERWEMA